VTVTAPPRPPRPSDPVDREELEALVEALIEEARRRARRRRRIYGAGATLVALVGAAIFTTLERNAQSQNSAPALFAQLSGPAATGTSKIAFIGEPLRGGYAGVLYVMNTDGSGQRRLAPAHKGARWSPDGQKLAFAGDEVPGDDVYVMNADGSGQERLTSGPGLDGSLAWSPDGRAIAFTRQQPPFHDRSAEIYVMNADGSEQRRLTRSAARDSYAATELAWSPRGNKIAFVSRRDGNLEIYVMNTDGTGQQRLTRNTVRDGNPVWSPDGRRIAFENNWQIYVMNADGRGQQRLTRNEGLNLRPAWSPDGQTIAFERRLGRHQSGRCSGCGDALAFEVHVMKADGSGQRRLTRKGVRNRAPAWSPNGRTIAFISNRDGNQEIYVMNANGSEQRNLTRTRDRRESWFVWSPAQKK
jgi:Tol biopolymer transport system component